MRNIRNWRQSNHFADDLTIIPIVGIIFIACLIALDTVGINGLQISIYSGNVQIYLVCFGALLAIDVIYTLWISKPESPISFLRRYFHLANHKKRIMRALPMIGAIAVFMPLFSTMKSSVPLFNQYSWDQTFIDLDRAMHGTDPWRILQPIMGYPLVTSIFSISYHLWILLIYIGGIYFVMYEHDSALRKRYLISFFGIWIVCGIVLAILLASVGPCFVGPILGNHAYDELMAYLYKADRQFPVMVLPVQEMLLERYRSNDHGLGRGITAMPSLHVAQAFLFFLAMRHKARWLAALFGVFALMILLGSVHLAYHYAVDGYVSIAVTATIWWLAGRLVNRPGSARTGTSPVAGMT